MTEVLFELLHLELVSRLQSEAEPEDPGHGKCISTLEQMGFRAGQGLIERFTKETPSFKDELDIMKFICKEFWTNLFRKQIDNLRTNHQGTYVLQDNRFRLLTPISSGKQYLEEAPKAHPNSNSLSCNSIVLTATMIGPQSLLTKFLAFTCGLLRGALSNLGIDCTVTAEVSAMPACKFHIVLQES